MNRIHELNTRLAQELGRNPHGAPLFTWERAHTLTRPSYTGQHRICDPEPGCLIARLEPIYENRPMFPEWGQRWVLTRWMEPASEAEWRATFGWQSEWPRHGYRVPTPVLLDEGEEPTVDVTVTVIGMIRADMARTQADLDAEVESRQERGEKSALSTIDSQVVDACTAFGNIPGTRSGGISLPSPEFVRNFTATT